MLLHGILADLAGYLSGCSRSPEYESRELKFECISNTSLLLFFYWN